MPVPLSHERGPYLELAPNYCIEFLRNSYPIIIVKLAKCLNVFGILTQAVGVQAVNLQPLLIEGVLGSNNLY